MRPKYAVFTIDVETLCDAECLMRYNLDSDVTALDGLDRYIDLMDKYNIKATLFVLSPVVPMIKDKLKKYIQNGHRIELHGSSHKSPMLLTDEEFRKEMIESKEMIERELGVTIKGYRAPLFSLDDKKLKILEELGFKYDASKLDFTHARNVGTITVEYFKQFLRGAYKSVQNNFYEFSAITSSFFGKIFPISGGGYLRLAPWQYMKPIIENYIKANDYYVFYLHPLDITEEKIPHFNKLKMYDRYYLTAGIKSYLQKVEQIIICLIQNHYNFVTFNDLTHIY